LQRLAPRVSHFLEQRHWWLGSANAMEKVEALLKEKATLTETMSSGHILFSRLKRGIEFKDVHFRHASQERETLAGVSLFIPCGETVAIVGTSGAGKSTLLDLLVRFYDPTAGSIRVDDCDLRDLDLVSWRRSIGLVSQDTFLFHDTVENNIRYGELRATTEDVINAALQAHAHRFISDLPGGYSTVVGDRGNMLSGGQRQRIALARAILRRPQLLILDEATNELDSESEEYIQQSIQKIRKTCTVVLVAHRLSTVEQAGRIYVIEHGMIVESGTHAELFKRGGRYEQFYQAQFKARSVLVR